MKFNRNSIPTAAKALWRVIKACFGPEPVLASPGVHAIRELRCENCVFNVDGQCTKCTCVIALKTQIATESCPRGFWGKQTRFSTGL